MDLSELASLARYVGSGEHERFPNPLADPALRTDASDCDAVDPTLSQDPARLILVLREAITRGQVSDVREGAFPRHVWAVMCLADATTRLVEARLTNAGNGDYKGYFIEEGDLVGKKAKYRARLLAGSWSAPL